MSSANVVFEGLSPPGPDAAAIRASLSELVIAWATDRTTRVPKYILEVERGLACDCVCPACGSTLQAVNSRNPRRRKRPYFRHVGGVQTKDCAVLAARQALLRVLADLPSDGPRFELPGRARSVEVRGLSGTTYWGHASVAPLEVVPKATRLVDAHSAAIRLDDGREVLVQLVATLSRSGDLPPEDKAVIRIAAGPAELALLASLAPQELLARLMLRLKDGEWCRHWEDDALDAAATRNAEEDARRHIDFLTAADGAGAASYESALHLAVKQIVAEARQMQLPALTARVERHPRPGSSPWIREWTSAPWRAEFTDVRLEQHLGRSVPDVVAEGPEGTICIEVTVANPLDTDREKRYEDLGAAVLEIDLRTFRGRVTREELRSLVVDRLEGKRWVHHPVQSAKYRDLLAAYEAEAGRFAETSVVDLVSAARERALAFYSARFDPSLEPALAEVLRALEDRGFAGAASRDFYGPARILPRLLSIALGRPIGYDVASVFEVINAIRQSQTARWAVLYLIALKVYDPPLTDKNRTWIAKWRDDVYAKVRHGDPDVRLPSHLDSTIALFFPELEEPLARWRFLSSTTGGPPSASAEAAPKDVDAWTMSSDAPLPAAEELRSRFAWTAGPLPLNRAERVKSMRRFYREGAFRHYAPRIDYDRVIAEAVEARRRGLEPSLLLAKWNRDYALGRELKPIVEVLRAAGLLA